MTNCRWVASDQPRVIKGRHETGCADDECAGCARCLDPHCTRCNHHHAAVTCTECVDRTRSDLHRIMDLCLMLPDESQEAGVASSAFMLDGPVADPPQWRRKALAAMLGRVCQCPSRGMVCPTIRGRVCPDAAYLEDCRDEPHALSVLGDWDETWRQMLSHETEQPMSLGRAFSYLDMQLSYMADQDWSDFDRFSTEARSCRVYLERVLGDDDRPETTDVPCLDCSRSLIKVYGRLAADDHWACPRKSCGRVYSESEFNLAKQDHLSGERAARWIRVPEAVALTGRSQWTLRAWISGGLVETQRDGDGPVMVWWPHVQNMHLTAPTRKRAG
jgi:hypothetical protein